MWKYSLARGVVVAGVVFIAAWAFAQPATQEQAVTRSAQDPQVQWGPCPAFMPAGCSLAVLHGDPAKPNVDVFLRIPANATIAEHWHTSAERMILVAGELVVRYQKQAEVVLRPGMYAYGPAKLSHTASYRGSAPCVLFIAFESAVDAVPTSTPAQ
jgi:mannose-6-phosphate isomerase-like protein (cupin superfamily)